LQDCTPRDALERLQEGNARFAAAWQQASGLASPQERMGQMQTVWQQGCQIDPLALAEGQRPFAALLSCADSRVDPAWLFACGAGELYEVRSAGNTAFREAIGSLEFAVGVLGVPLLLVLGHSGCGAVKAARGTAALSPLLEELVVPIRAHLVSGDDLTRAVQRNIGAAAEGLRAGSALIREAVAAFLGVASALGGSAPLAAAVALRCLAPVVLRLLREVRPPRWSCRADPVAVLASANTGRP
jgi:carbonic anhydrase